MDILRYPDSGFGRCPLSTRLVLSARARGAARYAAPSYPKRGRITDLSPPSSFDKLITPKHQASLVKPRFSEALKYGATSGVDAATEGGRRRPSLSFAGPTRRDSQSWDCRDSVSCVWLAAARNPEAHARGRLTMRMQMTRSTSPMNRT